VLREIGEALGPGREIVIVPGNHDHQLLSPWLERRARTAPPAPLGLESAVDWREGEALDTVAGWLGPASVRAAYPGVWLRPDVYATHGHYLDRHTTVPMFERLGAGAMARIVREPSGGPQRAEDYEAVLAPLYAWIHQIAQAGGPDVGASSHGASAGIWKSMSSRRAGRRAALRRRALGAAIPAAVAFINRAGVGPVRPDHSGPELRRAGLRAAGEVAARLGVQAEHLVFGHTHRAGPLATDDASEWAASRGPRLHNTGCWVHEPAFLGREPGASPYRAGFSVTLQDDGQPELACLLD
jgi:hypothetical protein